MMRQFVLLWVLWLAGWVSFLSGLVLNEVNFSAFDGPHYSLAFDEAPIPYSSAIGGDKVRIKSKEGFDYSCLIPAAKPPPKPKEEKVAMLIDHSCTFSFYFTYPFLLIIILDRRKKHLMWQSS